MLDYWLKAMQSPLGLWLRSRNRVLLRQQLYRARAEAKNEALAELVIIFPESPETDLWIAKRAECESLTNL